MPRFRLDVEYDGRPYNGWQSQQGAGGGTGRGVQDALEAAILAMTGERVRLVVAGRTDAGVHALGQVCHVDLGRAWRPDQLRDGLNTHLVQREERVAVLAAGPAPEGWSARLSAIRRHYVYRIGNRRPPPTVERGRLWHVPRPLDAAAMHEAAQRLIGHHDFSTFRAAACQAKSPWRTLERLDVGREGGDVDRKSGDVIVIRAAARSFLHNQVRRMVGSLELVGAGRWTADDLQRALERRDTAASGPQAPAWGLYFVGVDYDDRSASAPS